MAGTKISALTAVATATGADEFPVNEAGTTKKSTLTQVFTWLQAQVWTFAQAITLTNGATGNNAGDAYWNAAGATGSHFFRTNNGVTLLFTLDGGGHLISNVTGTPSVTNKGANVTSVTVTGNDTRGTMAILMAGALAANTRICTVTYAVTYGATAPILMLANETAGVGLASINFYRQAVSTGVSFDLASDFALAAGTYTCAYIAIG